VRRLGAWLLLGLALAAAIFAQQAIPPLEQRVTDLSGTLRTPAIAALERKLADFEARKGSQIVVLVVPTTAPEAIEQYGLRVAEAWELGRGEVDDGILLLVALQDRRVRIEVGYGLEGAVPDALARRVIDEQITPRFAGGDYAGGIEAGIDALVGLVDGEPLPPPAPRGDEVEDAFSVLPIALVLVAFLGPVFRRLLGALPGSLALGAGTTVIAWLLTSVLVMSLAIGAMVFLFALSNAGGRRHWASGGGWGGGFGRGGSGSRSGGFRGGGGRFGGGGASGHW
jgi:uncharacterized protein